MAKRSDYKAATATAAGAGGGTAGTEREDIPREYRRLDSIARLITGGDVCAAVAFDGRQFLVANNRHDETNPLTGDSLTRSYFEFFGKLAIEPRKTLKELESKENITEMYALVEKSIAEYVENKRERLDKLDVRKHLSQFRRINDEISSGRLEELRSRLRKDIRKVASSLAIDGNERKRFSPEMIGAFARGHRAAGSSVEAADIGGDAASLSEVAVASVAATAGGGGSAASSATSSMRGYEFVRGKSIAEDRSRFRRNAHAEMCILDSVIREDGRLAVADRGVREGKKPFYVGISKLCCPDCHAAVAVFNKGRSGYGVREVVDTDSASGSRRRDGVGLGEGEVLTATPSLSVAVASAGATTASVEGGSDSLKRRRPYEEGVAFGKAEESREENESRSDEEGKSGTGLIRKQERAKRSRKDCVSDAEEAESRGVASTLTALARRGSSGGGGGSGYAADAAMSDEESGREALRRELASLDRVPGALGVRGGHFLRTEGWVVPDFISSLGLEEEVDKMATGIAGIGERRVQLADASGSEPEIDDSSTRSRTAPAIAAPLTLSAPATDIGSGKDALSSAIRGGLLPRPLAIARHSAGSASAATLAASTDGGVALDRGLVAGGSAIGERRVPDPTRLVASLTAGATISGAASVSPGEAGARTGSPERGSRGSGEGAGPGGV